MPGPQIVPICCLLLLSGFNQDAPGETLGSPPHWKGRLRLLRLSSCGCFLLRNMNRERKEPWYRTKAETPCAWERSARARKLGSTSNCTPSGGGAPEPRASQRIPPSSLASTSLLPSFVSSAGICLERRLSSWESGGIYDSGASNFIGAFPVALTLCSSVSRPPEFGLEPVAPNCSAAPQSFLQPGSPSFVQTIRAQLTNTYQRKNVLRENCFTRYKCTAELSQIRSSRRGSAVNKPD